MADITKCTNAECHLKYFCYRHNAQSGFRQSWADMSDFSKSAKTCHNRIPDKCPKCAGAKIHKLECQTRKV